MGGRACFSHRCGPLFPPPTHNEQHSTAAAMASMDTHMDADTHTIQAGQVSEQHTQRMRCAEARSPSRPPVPLFPVRATRATIRRLRHSHTSSQQARMNSAHPLPPGAHSSAPFPFLFPFFRPPPLSLSLQVENSSLDSLVYAEVDPEETKNIEITEYPALTAEQVNDGKEQYLRVTVPPHRSVSRAHAHGT